MKRLALWLLVVTIAPCLRGQTPDAEFLQIYRSIQQAETLERSGDMSRALEAYRKARADLEEFSRTNPSWNRTIVNFRLGYLGEKVGSLKSRASTLPSTSTAALESLSPMDAAPVSRPGAEPTDGTPLSDLERALIRAREAETRLSLAQARADEATARANEMNDRAARLALELRAARDRLEVLEAARENLERARAALERDRVTLRAKLEEALRPRPASMDPAQLDRSEERNLLLMKENRILEACLQQQIAENKRIVQNAQRAVEFERQLQAAQTELAAARREADILRGERDRLVSRMESGDEERLRQVAELNLEIEALRRDLEATRALVDRNAPDGNREIAALRAELEEERARSEALRRENAALLVELDRATSIRITPASLRIPEVPMDAMAAEAARARRLERERDELRRQLEKLHSRLVSSGGGARVSDDDLETRVQTLEAQLDAFFTHTDPYTPAELALFQAPRRSEPIRPLLMAQADSPAPATNAATESRPANTNAPANTQPTGASSPSAAASPQGGAPSTRKTEKDLPPGAGPLAMQAQRAFRMRRFDEAEQAYREILKLDENNVFTLGNLAAILVEQGRIDQGEEFTQRALALDPDDPFCLSLLGIIRFRQERYEDAFEALSRSAQLDPTNADTQNYLGITLSQRGQRKAAEAALRKALKLNPSSPSAHYNLAVVYATQKPPFLELAKYHYEKARRAGQPANPAFEAILNGNASPEGKSGNE